MLKRDEILDPNSCWNKAKDDEMVFVLLGRDISSPNAIIAWVNSRIRKGKNMAGDDQLIEALKCAKTILDAG